MKTALKCIINLKNYKSTHSSGIRHLYQPGSFYFAMYDDPNNGHQRLTGYHDDKKQNIKDEYKEPLIPIQPLIV